MASNTTYPLYGGTPLTAIPNTFPGQTVLAINTDPNLDSSVYNIPFIAKSLNSVATLFGYGRFTRAIGELQRQNAPNIIMIAISSISSITSLFDYLIDQPFDIVLPVGVLATQTMVSNFASFALTREQTGNPIMIVMPAPTTASNTNLTVNTMSVNTPGLFASNFPTLNNYPIVSARNFVFTLDQLTINPDVPAEYTVDAAPSIAGLMVNKLPHISISGRTIRGANLNTPYSSTDALTLSNAGYTILKSTTRHGVVPYLGVTGTSTNPVSATYSPNYHKISTIRVPQYVSQQIKTATINMIGTNSSNATKTVVNNLLTHLQSSGIILAYSLDIQVTQTANAITITLSILPPYETTYITVSTQVNLEKS